MSFEEFENLARLYVVGALEADEIEEFRQVRQKLGRRAEEIISDCRKLNAAFALSLHPREPHPETREKLLDRIRDSILEDEIRVDKPLNGRAGGI
jgi:anti-sigma-K factor RskA